MNARDKKRYWLDDQRNVSVVVYVLYAACAILFVADGFYAKHGHFDFESWFGFYGVFGFVACVSLVLVAKAMRRVVMRASDYYRDEQPPPGDGSDD